MSFFTRDTGSRKRIVDEYVPLSGTKGSGSVDVNVCVGTSCFLKGSQRLLHEVLDYLRVNGLRAARKRERLLLLRAVRQGPTVRIGDQVLEKCTLDRAIQAIARQMGPARIEETLHG